MAWIVKNKLNIFWGAARLIYADDWTAIPTKFSDVFNTDWSLTTWWHDVGATDGGLTITRGYDKESWEVDQVLWPIDEWITQWKMSLKTALAENDLDNLNLAWVLWNQSVDTTTNPDEVTVKIEAPDTVPERMIAFQVDKRKSGGYQYKRLYIFYRAKYDGSDVEHSYKKGEKTLIPISFTLLVDTAQWWFGKIIDQVYGTYTTGG